MSSVREKKLLCFAQYLNPISAVSQILRMDSLWKRWSAWALYNIQTRSRVNPGSSNLRGSLIERLFGPSTLLEPWYVYYRNIRIVTYNTYMLMVMQSLTLMYWFEVSTSMMHICYHYRFLSKFISIHQRFRNSTLMSTRIISQRSQSMATHPLSTLSRRSNRRINLHSSFLLKFRQCILSNLNKNLIHPVP